MDDPVIRTYLNEILARVGIDQRFISQYHKPEDPNLPAAARAFLTPTNERLRDLKVRYARLRCDAVQHSQWSEEFVKSELPLQRFRGDCAFIWQKKDFNLPCTYVLTYYYLMTQGYGDLLRRSTEDDHFGVYSMVVDGEVITRDRLDSVCEIAFLRRLTSPPPSRELRVLDIGSGYGRLAQRLVQSSDNVVVYCVDAIAEASFLCEYYLRFRGVQDRAQVIPLTAVEDRFESLDIDLAINVHSFSECTLASISWWISLLKKHHVRYLFIVPNSGYAAGDHGGTQLLSTERNLGHLDFIPVLNGAGYRLIAMEPKFREPALQRFGVSPTHYFLFELKK
jgi:SAM-dependent methyltransferase